MQVEIGLGERERERGRDGFGSDGEREWVQTVAWELVTAGVEQMRIIVDKTDCITFTITHAQ